MIDASVLVNPVNIGGWGQQQLPAPDAQDLKRFEHFFAQGGISGGNDIDPNQITQESILSIVEPTNEGFGGFKQALLQKAQGMDDSYHSALSTWHDMPTLKDKLSIDSERVHVNQIRSYPEVSGSQNISSQIQKKANSAAQTILAFADQQNRINKWAVKMEVWSSHMKILSSVVGQVSQGFKTLFQAG